MSGKECGNWQAPNWEIFDYEGYNICKIVQKCTIARGNLALPAGKFCFFQNLRFETYLFPSQ